MCKLSAGNGPTRLPPKVKKDIDSYLDKLDHMALDIDKKFGDLSRSLETYRSTTHNLGEMLKKHLPTMKDLYNKCESITEISSNNLLDEQWEGMENCANMIQDIGEILAQFVLNK